MSSISSKKRMKTRRIVVKTNSFFRSLEEFTAWQFAFKINWPLESSGFELHKCNSYQNLQVQFIIQFFCVWRDWHYRSAQQQSTTFYQIFFCFFSRVCTTEASFAECVCFFFSVMFCLLSLYWTLAIIELMINKFHGVIALWWLSVSLWRICIIFFDQVNILHR